MSDKVEIPKQIFIKLKDSFEKFNQNENLELTSKKITQLRKKITEEEKEAYTHKLRTISLYTQEKNEILEIYIKELYKQYFPHES